MGWGVQVGVVSEDEVGEGGGRDVVRYTPLRCQL